ncbi:uncharacterized protein LOC144163713 [Haemaphysalis longicornis]
MFSSEQSRIRESCRVDQDASALLSKVLNMEINVVQPETRPPPDTLQGQRGGCVFDRRLRFGFGVPTPGPQKAPPAARRFGRTRRRDPVAGASCKVAPEVTAVGDCGLLSNRRHLPGGVAELGGEQSLRATCYHFSFPSEPAHLSVAATANPMALSPSSSGKEDLPTQMSLGAPEARCAAESTLTPWENQWSRECAVKLLRPARKPLFLFVCFFVAF